MTEKKSESKQILKEELENKKKLLQDYTGHLQRLQAEFDNFKKKVEKDRTALIENAHYELVQKLLNVLDEFELAFKSVKEDELVSGFKLIFNNFRAILEKEGLKEIKALNEKFDPNRHEVMLKEESDKDEGTVIGELQKGYILNDKILRYTKVKISMGGLKNE